MQQDIKYLKHGISLIGMLCRVLIIKDKLSGSVFKPVGQDILTG